MLLLLVLGRLGGGGRRGPGVVGVGFGGWLVVVDGRGGGVIMGCVVLGG